MFLRFFSLRFLMLGVVSESLPKAWVVPPGYGDFIAGIFAIIAAVALVHMAPWDLGVDTQHCPGPTPIQGAEFDC